MDSQADRKQSSKTGRFLAGNAGRPKGARGKRSRETLKEIAALGYEKPSISLLKIAHDKNTPPSVAVTALSAAAPYVEAKFAPTPPPRVNPTPISLTPPNTAGQVQEQIGMLVSKAAAGELALDVALDLVSMLKTYLLALAGGELEAKLTLIESVGSQPT
jgi:hypothetical protein